MPEGGEFEARERAPRGYELCPACIEVHGIAHAKAASKAAKAERYEESRRRRKQRVLRHTFREKIWGVEGWIDVEYSEDAECTICRSVLLANRFKCVSCPKFDLCRSCYQKVEEIHPVHAFLSLPDRPLPQLTPVQPAESVAGRVVETRPVHHPGAFCHNCLQDIVGPRFHCAVCPSWDLCIQCEGLGAAGDGQHTADHIMMKVGDKLGFFPLTPDSDSARNCRSRGRVPPRARQVVPAGLVDGCGRTFAVLAIELPHRRRRDGIRADWNGSRRRTRYAVRVRVHALDRHAFNGPHGPRRPGPQRALRKLQRVDHGPAVPVCQLPLGPGTVQPVLNLRAAEFPGP